MLNISSALEDYLEAVLILEEKKRFVRVKDLAQMMKVKAPSVNEALSHLKKRGLILQERYAPIELTSKGRGVAQAVLQKHEALKRFFQEVLGIDEKTAEEDACKVEHHLSKKTIKKIVSFTNRKKGKK